MGLGLIPAWHRAWWQQGHPAATLGTPAAGTPGRQDPNSTHGAPGGSGSRGAQPAEGQPPPQELGVEHGTAQPCSCPMEKLLSQTPRVPEQRQPGCFQPNAPACALTSERGSSSRALVGVFQAGISRSEAGEAQFITAIPPAGFGGSGCKRHGRPRWPRQRLAAPGERRAPAAGLPPGARCLPWEPPQLCSAKLQPLSLLLFPPVPSARPRSHTAVALPAAILRLPQRPAPRLGR